MAINTYGIPIKGLREASGYTTNLGRNRTGGYFEIFYDRADGQVWAVYNITADDRRTYPSPKIISICTTRTHMTMQQIVDKLRERLEESERHLMRLSSVYDSLKPLLEKLNSSLSAR